MAKSAKKSNTFVIEKATKVILRGRVNSTGELVSLYLDWHGPAGREYEFLEDKIYNKPQTPDQKKHNEAILRKASERLSLKNIEMLQDTTQLKSHYGNVKFTAFFTVARNHKKPDGDNKEHATKIIYDTCLRKLEDYKTDLHTYRLKDIDKTFVWGYREHLLSLGLSRSTAATYFQNLYSVLELAVKKEYIDKNPMIGVDPIRKEEPDINYIFHEDIMLLKQAHCDDHVLKKASLFASQTGMRAGDCKSLTWGKINYNKDQGKFSVVLTQEKTDKAYIVYFREDVMDIIGPAGSPDELVFPGLKNDIVANANLVLWFTRAGVVPRGKPDAKFTFHDFRHTFAIVLGMHGADLYQISKMLGHRSIRTTEKYYARILDEIKRRVIDNMPQL